MSADGDLARDDGPSEEPTAAPIDDEPTPATPHDILSDLAFAPVKKDWLVAGEYERVEEALARPRTTGEANNLGCAQAFLAVKTERPKYWGQALASLDRSVELAGADIVARERAHANSLVVEQARAAAGW